MVADEESWPPAEPYVFVGVPNNPRPPRPVGSDSWAPVAQTAPARALATLGVGTELAALEFMRRGGLRARPEVHGRAAAREARRGPASRMVTGSAQSERARSSSAFVICERPCTPCRFASWYSCALVRPRDPECDRLPPRCCGETSWVEVRLA
jgi:hypothetical protein